MCSEFLDIIRLLVKNLILLEQLRCVLLYRVVASADLRGKKYSDTFKHKTVFSVPLRSLGPFSNETTQSLEHNPFII